MFEFTSCATAAAAVAIDVDTIGGSPVLVNSFSSFPAAAAATAIVAVATVDDDNGIKLSSLDIIVSPMNAAPAFGVHIISGTCNTP